MSRLAGIDVEKSTDEYGGILTAPGDPTRGALLQIGVATYNIAAEDRYVQATFELT